ncbi:MAG: hypothetical protein KAT69_07870 [Candidatus Aminicenantes bacterium]|nr:hypothetical protein [Candidatus Aminicenantes bacterium]
MAIISKETIYISGEKFIKATKVSSRGKFSIDLPESFIDAFGVKNVSGDSLSSVNKQFGEFCHKFKDAKKTTKKVIAYQLQAECDSLDLNADGISFLDGLGLAVSAVLLTETTTETANGMKSYSYDPITLDIDDNDFEYNYHPLGRSLFDRSIYPHRTESKKAENIMEWTQEREDFFIDLGKAMKKLIQQCDQIMSGNDSITKFIASKQKLLR